MQMSTATQYAKQLALYKMLFPDRLPIPYKTEILLMGLRYENIEH